MPIPQNIVFVLPATVTDPEIQIYPLLWSYQTILWRAECFYVTTRLKDDLQMLACGTHQQYLYLSTAVPWPVYRGLSLGSY
eukprot:SAG11_NODE_6149_length_1377_cov_0.977308_1_plen_80_part_10